MFLNTRLNCLTYVYLESSWHKVQILAQEFMTRGRHLFCKELRNKNTTHILRLYIRTDTQIYVFFIHLNGIWTWRHFCLNLESWILSGMESEPGFIFVQITRDNVPIYQDCNYSFERVVFWQNSYTEINKFLNLVESNQIQIVIIFFQLILDQTQVRIGNKFTAEKWCNAEK